MKYPVILLSAVMLLACNRNAEYGSLEPIDNSFPIDIAANDSIMEFPDIFAIKQWSIIGDTLFILSNGQDSIVSMVDINDMSLIDAFGSIGQGPDEALSANLVNSENNGIFLGDGMTGKIRRIENRRLGEIVSDAGRPIPMNDAYLVNPTNLVYVSYSPQNTQLLIQDMSDNCINDSLCLPVMSESAQKFGKSTSDFKVGGNGKFFVIAYQGMDLFEIVRRSGLRFQSPVAYKGNAPEGEFNFFFIDVVCGADYFAMLSMKEKDVRAENEFPDIELYNYDGSPVARISISFPAYKILIDNNRKQLLLLSANDESLHIIPIPEHI